MLSPHKGRLTSFCYDDDDDDRRVASCCIFVGIVHFLSYHTTGDLAQSVGFLVSMLCLAVQTEPFSILQFTRSGNVDKYTEELLTVKCRGAPGTSFESQSPDLHFSAFLTPPQTINWTLAACKPAAQSVTICLYHSGNRTVRGTEGQTDSKQLDRNLKI